MSELQSAYQVETRVSSVATPVAAHQPSPAAIPVPQAESVLHVVGDKFSFFCQENPGVVTFSGLERLLDKRPTQPLALIIGQGVSLERLRELELRIEQGPARGHVSIREARVRDRAPGKYTHKHFDRNTIISTPYKDDAENLYRAHLLLDDDCAEMSDHVTGHHLQGIVFFEAARQMFLAATERYWLEKLGRPYYFVINEFNTTYHTFGFPLPTEITMKVVEERGDTRKTGAVFLDVLIEFFQVGVPITECSVKYAAFDKVLLSAREGLLSRLALLKLSPSLVPARERH
jgi:hypothetical protein